MIGLDTSVVVRLLIGEPVSQARAARALVAKSGGEVMVSDLVVAESYFALCHHYAVPHGEAVSALRALLGDARIVATGVALEVLRRVPDEESAPGLMDRLIHADYEVDGAEMHTFDRGAARLGRAKLVKGG